MSFSPVPLRQRSSYRECEGAWVLTPPSDHCPRFLCRVVDYADDRYDGCRILEVAYRDPDNHYLNGMRQRYAEDVLVVVDPTQAGWREAVISGDLAAVLPTAPPPSRSRL